MSTDDIQNDDADDGGESFAELADAMDEVDTDAPDAEQNETTISDNNGGRIELGEDEADEGLIRK